MIMRREEEEGGGGSRIIQVEQVTSVEVDGRRCKMLRFWAGEHARHSRQDSFPSSLVTERLPPATKEKENHSSSDNKAKESFHDESTTTPVFALLLDGPTATADPMSESVVVIFCHSNNNHNNARRRRTGTSSPSCGEFRHDIAVASPPPTSLGSVVDQTARLCTAIQYNRCASKLSRSRTIHVDTIAAIQLQTSTGQHQTTSIYNDNTPTDVITYQTSTIARHQLLLGFARTCLATANERVDRLCPTTRTLQGTGQSSDQFGYLGPQSTTGIQKVASQPTIDIDSHTDATVTGTGVLGMASFPYRHVESTISTTRGISTANGDHPSATIRQCTVVTLV